MSAPGTQVAPKTRQAMIDVQIVDAPVRYQSFDQFPQPAGAEAVFLGRTRKEVHPEHGVLKRLSYEAYRPMAERILRQLADDAVVQFNCLAVRIHHAIGEVPPGEASVLVQVVCGHRGASFDACRFLIDSLKEQAPIWKKDEWADGATWSQGQPVATAPPTDAAS